MVHLFDATSRIDCWGVRIRPHHARNSGWGRYRVLGIQTLSYVTDITHHFVHDRIPIYMLHALGYEMSRIAEMEILLKKLIKALYQIDDITRTYTRGPLRTYEEQSKMVQKIARDAEYEYDKATAEWGMR